MDDSKWESLYGVIDKLLKNLVKERKQELAEVSTNKEYEHKVTQLILYHTGDQGKREKAFPRLEKFKQRRAAKNNAIIISKNSDKNNFQMLKEVREKKKEMTQKRIEVKAVKET